MKVKKRLNNNAVVALDNQKKEVILTGKGLGFQVQIGEEIDVAKIEKTFTLQNETTKQQLQELMQQIPVEYVTLADELYDYAAIHVRKPLDEHVIIHLSDHLHTAAMRIKQGITLNNALLYEIKRFYPDEYQVGLHALTRVQDLFQITLPEDEAGFLAIHLVNAGLSEDLTVSKVATLMEEIESIVQKRLQCQLSTTSVYYNRFLTHLKFFAERVLKGELNQAPNIEHMLAVIIDNYPQVYECVLKIRQFIQTKYQYQLTEADLLYLGIHISRMVEITKQKG